MSDKPPIPSLPPLSSIQDRSVRTVLQSIYDSWRVRNGDVGTGEHKFLTVKDLKDVFTVGRLAGPGGSLTGGSAINGAAAVVEAIINRVTDSVMTSRMWTALGERLTWIETPEWFQDKFGAAIVTEQLERESNDNAIAEQVTTAVANINGNIALVQDQVTATSNLAGSTASDVVTLQTDVANNKVIAQNAFTLSQTTDGKLSAAWSVKVDANGYVSGFGYGVDGKSGNYVSDFTVRADRFSIGAPSGQGITPTVPFVVYSTPQVIGGQLVQPGVYIKDAYIANGTIGTAKIADLAVDTLNIAGNAVTVPGYSNSTTAFDNYPGTYRNDVINLTLSYNAPAKVTLICTVYGFNYGTSTNMTCRFRTSGGYSKAFSISMMDLFGAASTFVTAVDVPSGSTTFAVDIGNNWSSGGPWRTSNINLVVLGVMK